MLISEKLVYRNEKAQQVVSWLFCASTYLEQKIEIVVKCVEGEEGTELFFGMETLEPSDYHRWMSDERVGSKDSEWKEVQQVPAGAIEEIPMPQVEQALVKTRRDLLDSAEQQIIRSTGIPRRLLEPPHDR